MKWLEVIELRAVHMDQAFLIKQIIHLLDEMKNEYAISVYVNLQPESDLSIHVHHESEPVEASGSIFAVQVRKIFQKWGHVSQSVWIEKPQ